jgi:transposase
MRALAAGLRTGRWWSAAINHTCALAAKIRARCKNGYQPRRWIVELAHSWFNRFRKLLVRYEKTHRAYLALNTLAAAIICFRKVRGDINIIRG